MSKHTIKSGVLAIVLVTMIVTLAFGQGMRVHAQVSVCGDGERGSDEKCDDGNLVVGDGCSDMCTIERCGNNIIDAGEQCDGEGSLPIGQGCDDQCFIAFCGDGEVQINRGETCDDGNAIAGDGCSATCTMEKADTQKDPADTEKSTQSESTPPVNIPPLLHPAAPPTLSPLPPLPTLPPLLQHSITEIASIAPTIDRVRLNEILEALTRGKKLTDKERTEATTIADLLEETLRKNRVTFIDLLQRFITSPISAGIIADRTMDASKLTAGDLEKIAAELRRIPRRSPAAIKQATITALDQVRVFDPSLPDLPSDFLSRTPLEQFQIIQTFKERLERDATRDKAGSMRRIVASAITMRGTYPDAARNDPSIDMPQVRDVIDAFITAASRAEPGETRTVLAAGRALTQALVGAGRKRDPQASTPVIDVLHAAAPTLAKRTTDNPEAVRGKEASFIHALAASAPLRARRAFEQDDVRKQAEALRDLLAEDAALQRLLRLPDADPSMKASMLMINVGLDAVGTPAAGSVPCSIDIREVTRCIDTMLVTIEEQTKNHSTFMKAITRIRTLFPFFDGQ